MQLHNSDLASSCLELCVLLISTLIRTEYLVIRASYVWHFINQFIQQIRRIWRFQFFFEKFLSIVCKSSFSGECVLFGSFSYFDFHYSAVIERFYVNYALALCAITVRFYFVWNEFSSNKINATFGFCISDDNCTEVVGPLFFQKLSVSAWIFFFTPDWNIFCSASFNFIVTHESQDQKSSSTSLFFFHWAHCSINC